MPRPSLITLFLAIAVAQVLVATVPAANALQGVGVPPHLANRAEHVNVNRRMVKQRRAAADEDTPVNPAAGVDDTTTTTPPASSSTPASGNGNGNANTRTTSSAQTSQSQNGGLGATISQLLNGSSSSSTTTSTSTTSTSSTPPPTSTPQSTPQSSTSTVHSTTRGGTVVYVTASVTDSATAPDNSQNQNTSFLPKPVIIGLIVAGSCVVAAAAIWTVIRKWKFSPSRHFEDRLEPINWEPTQASGVDHDPTMAALGRSTSRTGTSRPDSFHSGDGGHGSVRNMSTAHNDSLTMAPDFPPPHDFTAGPSGLNAGYVDMHRGPSPAPTQYGVGAYGGQYEAPNPYDAYDYNSGYGQQQRRY